MIDTLSITISRSWPAMSTPMANAARIAISTPNSRNAKKIAPTVKNVRNFRREQVAPDDGKELHAHRLLHEHALLEVQRPLRARRRVRVVRDHDDRLAVLAVQRLEQIEDLVARPCDRGRRSARRRAAASGSVTIARAMPTRCSWPPES